MQEIIDAPSPNFDARGGAALDMIVLHYTGMKTGAAALARLRDPAAKVSAHYLVEEDGRVFRLVAEECRAWHAGVAYWAGDTNINARSIGIEIVNPGHEWGLRPFPEAQIAAVIALLKDIRTRHRVPASRVVAHSDVAPERKEDPGELFAWARLATEGLALAPYDGPPDGSPDWALCVRMLGEIGYRADLAAPVATVLAFQRRFCPQALGRGMNALTKAAIASVHAAMK